MNPFKKFFKNPNHFRSVIGHRKNGRLSHLNDEDYREQIIKHISILKSLGFKPGDKVAIMAETSLEWHLFDMATTLYGGVVVPIYTTFSKRDLSSIFDLAKPDFIIFQSCYLYNLHSSLLKSNINSIILHEDTKIADHKNESSYRYLYDSIKSIGEEEDEIDLIKLAGNLKQEDVCSLLVTSGTTGIPKVAVFTFGALCSLLENIEAAMGGRIKPGSRSLTSLPLAHVLGRCDSLLHYALPVQTIFGESMETFTTDLQLIKPSYMVTVPRILTKIRERTLKSISNSGKINEALFNLAFQTCQNFFQKIDQNKVPSNYEKKLFQYFQKSVLQKVKEKISVDLDFLVTGGGPLLEEDYIFYRVLGIPVLEGYGLTETLGPVCMNPIEDPQCGNVGHPYRDVEIKIDTDGEILIKSPFMLKGYLGQDGKSPFDELGFLKTGDIGDVTKDGRLKITDRKKDVIVNSYGKNIYPLKIESLFITSPIIENILVTGEGKPFLTALIFTSKNRFADLIDDGILDPEISAEQLTQSPIVQERIHLEVDRINEELANHEKIKKFRLVPLHLDSSDSFITPSLKLKRDHIYNKYQSDIDKLYS